MNATLIVLIENINGPKPKGVTDADLDQQLRNRQNAYFRFILWATFGLSAVRFLGVRNYFGFLPTSIIAQRVHSLIPSLL
jgi:chitin synthase